MTIAMATETNQPTTMRGLVACKLAFVCVRVADREDFLTSRKFSRYSRQKRLSNDPVTLVITATSYTFSPHLLIQRARSQSHRHKNLDLG